MAIFNESKEEKKMNYDVTVTHVRVKDKKILFDLVVNGVTIYNMTYREYTNKQGGDGTMLTFPSYKNGDKYYNNVFFPIYKEIKELIVKEIEKAVRSKAKN